MLKLFQKKKKKKLNKLCAFNPIWTRTFFYWFLNLIFKTKLFPSSNPKCHGITTKKKKKKNVEPFIYIYFSKIDIIK